MEVVAGAMSPLLNKLGELLKDEYNLEQKVSRSGSGQARVTKLLKKTTGLFRKGKDLHQIAGAIKEAQELAKQLARGTSLSCMAATLVLPLTLV
ncbi:hypothetical protein E2562_003660 [Oryza meyeriana var. granulata]|uniref:Uncharacterized protein n=1 Tax=Oryza meyeriana var. granulata TaxID=110450 RepID=A0A6G1C3P9_9ORYZ|nr:hypothetical protein E2562_003660 [Oryza meyeriana var. granulata]